MASSPLSDLPSQELTTGEKERKVNMNPSIQSKTTVPPIINSTNRSPLRRGLPRARSLWIIRGFVLIPLVLVCIELFSNAQAVVPAPDGGYPGGNTAEGANALLNLTSGIDNTAVGSGALHDTTTGILNTANGFQALYHNTGSENTANGFQALFSNATGGANTAMGLQALFHNTGGNNNTATGSQALYSNTTGIYNTASGVEALFSNTTGNNNTATGYSALLVNTRGVDNTATGFEALQDNGTGFDNTANGSEALSGNTRGYDNTATGVEALFSNITGHDNTANGLKALFSNTTINGVSGSDNTANGVNALFSNTTGSQNTATGLGALYSNTTSNNNTANGFAALYSNITTGGNNTAEGFKALYSNTGANNIGLGSNAGSSLTTGSNNIDIGNVGVAAESNTIRIGKQGTQTRTFVAGITGATVTGATVMVNTTTGQLGIGAISSRRFKDEIKPMDKASEAILALKPVTFHYKKELDPEGIPQFGLVAEEVENVNPDLVTRDAKGEVYTVRYEAVNAMLLNEFLKEHRTVEELKSDAAKQEKEIKALIGIVKEQAAQLQKVSAQLEASKPGPQMVANEQ
jgi:hypothetical protein